MKNSSVLRKVAILVAVFVLLAGGCLSPSGKVGPDNSVKVSLVKSGTVEIDGRAMPVDQLASRLKRMGANPTTSVIVAVPEKTTNHDLASLTRQLRSAGFIKVIFTKPRHTDTNISTPARQ